MVLLSWSHSTGRWHTLCTGNMPRRTCTSTWPARPLRTCWRRCVVEQLCRKCVNVLLSQPGHPAQQGRSKAALQEAARALIEEFVVESAPSEINISYQQRREILSRVCTMVGVVRVATIYCNAQFGARSIALTFLKPPSNFGKLEVNANAITLCDSWRKGMWARICLSRHRCTS